MINGQPAEKPRRAKRAFMALWTLVNFVLLIVVIAVCLLVVGFGLGLIFRALWDAFTFGWELIP